MVDAQRTLVESFVVATFTLRFSGLFPYSYQVKYNEFRLSWPLLTSTILQLCIYIYVNFSLMMSDWRDYAQPVASSSSLAVVGNLLLRLLGLMSTMMVLLPSLLGSRQLVRDINHQLRFGKNFVELGFDTYQLYRQLRFLSLVSSLALFIWVYLNCWHVVHFYELLTKRTAKLSYYMVVALSDYYRMLFIFFLRVQLLGLYYISQQINGFLLDIIKMESWRYERRCSAAIVSNVK